MTKETMIIRIDQETKSKVSRLAKIEGKSTSQVVREVLEEYVKNRDIEAYIDDLWKRVGEKLKSRAVDHRSIPRIVRETRKKRK